MKRLWFRLITNSLPREKKVDNRNPLNSYWIERIKLRLFSFWCSFDFVMTLARVILIECLAPSSPKRHSLHLWCGFNYFPALRRMNCLRMTSRDGENLAKEAIVEMQTKDRKGDDMEALEANLIIPATNPQRSFHVNLYGQVKNPHCCDRASKTFPFAVNCWICSVFLL